MRAFGLRVSGRARPHSDLDLAVSGVEPLDWRQSEAFKDAFAESDLPFLVDVVDWHRLSTEFRALIAETSVVLQEGADARSPAPDVTNKNRSCYRGEEARV